MKTIARRQKLTSRLLARAARLVVEHSQNGEARRLAWKVWDLTACRASERLPLIAPSLWRGVLRLDPQDWVGQAQVASLAEAIAQVARGE